MNNMQMDPRLKVIMQLKNGANPQQIVMSMLQQGASQNPMAQNFLALANSHKTNDMERIVRNMYQAKGLDFDKASSELKEMLRR